MLAGVALPLWSLFPLGAAIHPVMYAAFLRYRLWAEVAAYRIQAKHYPDDRRPLFARFIAQHYGIDVSEQEALELLKR